MKKIFLPPFIMLFLAGIFFEADAQKKLTEGKAIFDITYPESELDQQTLARLPSESTIYFKNYMSRVEMKMPMGNTVAITNGRSGETITLLDMMGNRIGVKITKEEIEKQKKNLDLEKSEIKITDQTKTIAGYPCKKAQLLIKEKDGKEITMEAWFTGDISAPNSVRSGGMNFEGIDGFMMEYQTKMSSITMKMSCRSVEKAVVPDSMFVIPTDYQVTTPKDLNKHFSIGDH